MLRVRPMNERELFTSDETVVQIDEQDPQQMQVCHFLLCLNAANAVGLANFAICMPGRHCSEQVCMASSDLVHIHLTLAGMRFVFSSNCHH